LAAVLALIAALVDTAAAVQLPDNRAYEQVSPVDKNGGDIEGASAVAAIDGNRLAFESSGSFAGAAGSAATVEYLATRGADSWATEAIALPGGRLFGQNGYMGFTPDLSKGVVRWIEDTATLGTFDPEAVPGVNLYVRDNLAGTFSLLNGTLNQATFAGGFAWATPDFGRIAFSSPRKLTSDSPCSESEFQPHCAYEEDDGVLKLASVLPSGEPVDGTLGGGSTNLLGNIDNAVSDDGSRLFFSTPGTDFTYEIYAREDGESTLISGSERTLPGGASGYVVHYQGAEAAHGNRVIFTTRNSLVDADTDEANDLYLYDFTAPAGERLTLISADGNPAAPEGAEVEEATSSGTGGILAKSEDLRRVYFVAANQIVAGEPEEAGPKLYLWDATGATPHLTYIATLEAGDSGAWRGRSVENGGVMKAARSSRDGRFVVFLSTAKLTSFDNEGAQEIYRYDAVSNALVCVSCVSDAFPATGYVGFNRGASGSDPPVNHLLKNTSDSGQVFFETARGLLPRDSNGKIDVYEFEGGQLQLISSGTGGTDSRFMDATPSGSDVFFVTGDQLVGWDRDDQIDAYDARVNGGLPEPPIPPPPCEGDACQPPPVVPNDPTPASAGFRGPGDPSARKHSRRCAKGKVRRRGKCRKRQARHAHPRRNHNATRSHG